MARSAPLPKTIYPDTMCAQKLRQGGAHARTVKILKSAPNRQWLPTPTPSMNVPGREGEAGESKESESLNDEQAIESFTPPPRALQPQHQPRPVPQHRFSNRQQDSGLPTAQDVPTIPLVQTRVARPTYSQTLQHRTALYRWAVSHRSQWRDASNLPYLRATMRANDEEDPIYPEILEFQDANREMSEVDREMIVWHTVDTVEKVRFADVYATCYGRQIGDAVIEKLQLARARVHVRRERESKGALCRIPTPSQIARLRTTPWLPSDEGYDQAIEDCPVGAYATREKAWRDALATLEHMRFCDYGGTSCKHANLKVYWNEMRGRWDVCEGDRDES